VTWHGIAINVEPNMQHFGMIIPCGISDRPVASLSELLDPVPAVSTVMDAFESRMRNFVA
jgi:lipoyl(octanoyl) transferase